MTDDIRCCGTGTCIIDPEGRCWCGQVWDGEKMAFQTASPDAAASADTAPVAKPVE